jgi:hypothetical protein
MVKVSITLPNTAQITFESEEPEVVHEVVGLVLRDLPRELMLSTQPAGGGNGLPAPLEKGTGVTETPITPQPPAAAAPATSQGQGQGQAQRESEKFPAPDRPEPPQIVRSPEAEAAFTEFCRSANPLGDMRRVVVVADAARRFFGMESVDGSELAWLFNLAGWRQSHNFTQTLRNAARDKFRWLERLPGRTGRYTATAQGRAVTLDE